MFTSFPDYLLSVLVPSLVMAMVATTIVMSVIWLMERARVNEGKRRHWHWYELMEWEMATRKLRRAYASWDRYAGIKEHLASCSACTALHQEVCEILNKAAARYGSPVPSQNSPPQGTRAVT